MIGVFNSAFGGIFTAMFYPLRSLSPWFAMVLVSVLTAMLMLLIYRTTSNQEAIRVTKDRIKAHLLELRLYQDSLATTFRSQGKILRYNMKYMGHAVWPMLVMIIPVVLILIHLDLWFGYRSLQPGETALLKVTLQEGAQPSRMEIAAEDGPGVAIDTPPLRLDSEAEVDWRVRAMQAGLHDVTIRVGGETVTKQVAVSARPLARISPVRVGPGFIGQILNPAEPVLPSASSVKSIEVVYPGSTMSLFGWNLHWLIVYFALSIIFGFGLKGFFGVEV